MSTTPLDPPLETRDTPIETQLETVQCALCGHRFLPAEEIVACGRCPLQRRCAVRCCPRCGYQFVTESMLVRFLRRLFPR